jgi:hypothetical protein
VKRNVNILLSVLNLYFFKWVNSVITLLASTFVQNRTLRYQAEDIFVLVQFAIVSLESTFIILFYSWELLRQLT